VTYSPNLPIGSGWKSTLQAAFQTLRRVKFIIEENFSFGDFDPQVNWNGMTVSAVNIRKARYLKLFKLFFVSVDIQATLAAPLTLNVTITIPETIYGTSTEYQSGAGSGNSGGPAVTLVWQAQGTTDKILIYRYDFANYGAGVFRGVFNGFLEIT